MSQPARRSFAPEPLLRPDFESASVLLAEGFFSNPAHVYIFPEENRRRRSLQWLLRWNLEIQNPLEHSFRVAEAPRAPGRHVVAMGFWHAPGARSVSVRGLMRPAMLALPFKCGLDAARRALEVTSCLEKQRWEALGPAWFLNNMVVAEHLRGTGLGTELLSRELRDRVDPSGEPALLATQRPENVVFYRRLGFEVASERTLGSRSHAFRNWIMVREPRPA
jgi:GNAT superfamily N-acetyltransferase